jgi:hypothetical protein
MVIDYREAFDEWLKLDPLNNPSATPGRAYMPGYKNPNLEEAEQLNTEAWRVGAKHRDDRFWAPEGINPKTPALTRHKIISHGQDHHDGSG